MHIKELSLISIYRPDFSTKAFETMRIDPVQSPTVQTNYPGWGRDSKWAGMVFWAREN